MAAVDTLTNAIPTVVMAGVTLGVTKATLGLIEGMDRPRRPFGRPMRRSNRRYPRRTGVGFGNFRNVGL